MSSGSSSERKPKTPVAVTRPGMSGEAEMENLGSEGIQRRGRFEWSRVESCPEMSEGVSQGLCVRFGCGCGCDGIQRTRLRRRCDVANVQATATEAGRQERTVGTSHPRQGQLCLDAGTRYRCASENVAGSL